YDGPPGVFREFGTPAINNWEHVAYAASVEVFANQYQPARTENGIWFALGSTNREVVRSGVAEPGEAFEFRHFGQVNLSDANAVVFGATPDSHTYRNPGLWLYRLRGEL